MDAPKAPRRPALGVALLTLGVAMLLLAGAMFAGDARGTGPLAGWARARKPDPRPDPGKTVTHPAPTPLLALFVAAAAVTPTVFGACYLLGQKPPDVRRYSPRGSGPLD